MIRKLPHWITKTQHPKSVHLLELLRDYVLIMANTGMRHGTEAQNLRWQFNAILGLQSNILEMLFWGSFQRERDANFKFL